MNNTGLKLLTEFIDFKSFEVLTEGEGADSIVRIKGPFLEAELQNKNKRRYKKSLCEREVTKFNEEKIQHNRALGELDHPPSPQINLDRVSHKIESLVMEGNQGIGVAKLIDTPMGKIAKTLVREGIVLGVSTRGVGSLGSDGWVNENFNLITIDIVADPSAPNSFVDGILENKEYVIEGNDIVEVAVENLQKKMDKNGSKVALEAMLDFIDSIK